MDKDVVCAEAELSAAANKITQYADFLSETLESYIAILGEIQERGIQDELICSKLSSVAESLSSYTSTVSSEAAAVAADVKEYISMVEKADNFQFPGVSSLTIRMLLSGIL